MEHEKWKHENENMRNENMKMETWNTTRLTHLTRAARKLENCSKPAFYISKALLENCSKPAFYINDSARKLSFTSTVPVFYIDDSARKLSFTSTALLKTSARKPLQPDFSSNLFYCRKFCNKKLKTARKHTFRANISS